MSTYSAKQETVTHDWHLVDASKQILGRLATQIAMHLRGKHKPIYTPHVDTGDYVVVINAEQIRISGKKATQKYYYSHSEYPGGIKEISFEKLLAKNPVKIIELAVKRMLPRTPLGRQMLRKLKVYAGNTHPHSAQEPQPINLVKIKANREE